MVMVQWQQNHWITIESNGAPEKNHYHPIVLTKLPSLKSTLFCLAFAATLICNILQLPVLRQNFYPPLKSVFFFPVQYQFQDYLLPSSHNMLLHPVLKLVPVLILIHNLRSNLPLKNHKSIIIRRAYKGQPKMCVIMTTSLQIRQILYRGFQKCLVLVLSVYVNPQSLIIPCF